MGKGVDIERASRQTEVGYATPMRGDHMHARLMG